MILRLLLIFYLLSLGSPVLAQKIDLKLCVDNAACFVRESCFESGGRTAVLATYDGRATLTKDCDVILQGRAFSGTKFHIIVQVKSPVEEITGGGVSLVQGPNKDIQFQCTKNQPTTPNSDLSIESNLMTDVKSDSIFCSFILSSKKSSEKIVDIFSDNPGQPTIVFQKNNVDDKIVFALRKNIFWDAIKNKQACDPSGIITEDAKDETHIFEKVDSQQTDITCDGIGILQIIRKAGSVEMKDYPEELKCNDEHWWSYNVQNGATTITHKINRDTQDKFNVSCVYMICSLCKPLEYFNCGNGCVNMITKEGSSRECATNTCAKNLWRVDHESPRNGTIECRQREGSTNLKDSIWYFVPSDPSLEKEEISKAACAVDANCREDSGVEWKCPQVNGQPIGCETELYDENKGAVCPNGTKLTIQNGKGQPFESSFLTCDVITGRYKDNKSAEIDYNSTAYCLKSDLSTGPSESAGMSDNAVKIGVIVLAVIIFVVLPIGFGVNYFRNRKKPLFASKVNSEKGKGKADREALRRQPNPTRTVNRRGLAYDELTKWERRVYRWQHCVVTPREDEIQYWDDAKFCATLAYDFLQYGRDVKLIVLARLTALDAYNMESTAYEKNYTRNKADPTRIKDHEFGTLKQFFWLWRACAEHMMDDWVAWEHMWQFMRMLYEGFALYDDDREVCKRIIVLVTDWARAMLNEFSYKRRENEDQCDTWLRFLAVRILLWAEVPDVVEELTRLANEPWGTLESPMRAIVFAHSCRNMGRAEEFKERHWADIQADEQVGYAEEVERFGTRRQHLLYGLCASRDESQKGFDGEFKVLKETFTAIWDYTRMNEPTESYTPRDQLWALKGVSEFVTNFSPAIDHLVTIMPTDFEGTMDQFLGFRSKAAGVAFDTLKEEWIADIEKFVLLGAECCMARHQFALYAAMIEPIMQYCQRPNPDNPNGEYLKPWFPVKEYQDRPFNLSNLLAHNQITDFMYDALVGRTKGIPVPKFTAKRGPGPAWYDPATVIDHELEKKIFDLQASCANEIPKIRRMENKKIAEQRAAREKREKKENEEREREEMEWNRVHGFGEDDVRRCGPCEKCAEVDENRRLALKRGYEEQLDNFEKNFRALPEAEREAKHWEHKVGRYRERSARSPDPEEKTARSDRTPDLEEKTARL